MVGTAPLEGGPLTLSGPPTPYFCSQFVVVELAVHQATQISLFLSFAI
jgi:hypothetical protein